MKNSEKEVIIMALWGGRFAKSAAESVRNFTESISYDRRLYKHDIQGSQAHARMLAKAGIIPAASAEAICAELDHIRERIEKGDFNYSSELEDIHMHIESALIEKLGDEGARVHTARSRNDQVNLDIRLYLRDEIPSIIARSVPFRTRWSNRPMRTNAPFCPASPIFSTPSRCCWRTICWPTRKCSNATSDVSPTPAAV